MRFLSWLRNGKLSQAHARGRAPSARRPRATFRPRVEALEGRDVPSTLWTVMNNLDSGPGSLRAEIAAAQGGDTVAFSNSLKGQAITLTTGELLLNKGLTIQGPGAGQLAISGGNTSRVFEVAAGVQVTLAGLTISGGDGQASVVAYYTGFYDGDGGAILNWGTLAVNNCTVSGSSAGANGGGIYSAGTLTVSHNSSVVGNVASGTAYTTAAEGGGIYNAGTAAALTVLDSTFSNNSPDNIFGPYTDGGGNTFS